MPIGNGVRGIHLSGDEAELDNTKLRVLLGANSINLVLLL